MQRVISYWGSFWEVNQPVNFVNDMKYLLKYLLENYVVLRVWWKA